MKVGGDVLAALGLAVLLALGAVWVDSGAVAWMVAPLVILLAVYSMARSPLRYSLAGLAFLALVLENPSELPAYGQWQSPIYPIGMLMMMHLNNSTGVKALFFSGMDIFLVVAAIIAAYRVASGSKVDSIGRVATPRPLVKLALLSLAATLAVWIIGMLRGGDFRMSLWQVEKVIYLPFVFILFHLALRGPKDYFMLGRVLLVAAFIRAAMAIYLANTITVPGEDGTPEPPPYATTHHDSMLFANAFVLLVSLLLNRVGRSGVRLSLLLLPVLVAGMIFNGRRLVWVEVAIVFVTLYLSTPPNPFKRKLARWLKFASPLILGYLIVGWNQKGGFFGPVAMIRSVIDSSADSSSLWRDVENFNLIYTLKQYPLVGTGYGFGYWEMWSLPSIAAMYELYRHCPHNSILGTWAFAGLAGYTATTLLWVVGVYFAMRAYHATKAPMDRAAALTSLGVILVYLVHCYGDMGLGTWGGTFTVAPALAMAGKLAVATGAWTTSRRTAPAGAFSANNLPADGQGATPTPQAQPQ